MLKNISTLATVPAEQLMPIQPMDMETKVNTATLYHALTDIPEETTAKNVTAMDVALPTKALEPSLYLATPMVLPGPQMMATVAPARYISPVRFSQQIISDTQWNTLAATLIAHSFPPPPPPSMLFPEHHWCDYPLALKDQIKEILLPPTNPAPATPQQTSSVPRAPIVTQLAPQLMAIQLPLTVPMDVQLPQPPSTSTPNVDHYGQPIHKTA
uniref:Uncharacterized protein n=1 Tax=Romanomermis culicivorax TaxID=13658 RepID=A0A915JMI9_ROMCU